jgi:hypothetical protein
LSIRKQQYSSLRCKEGVVTGGKFEAKGYSSYAPKDGIFNLHPTTTGMLMDQSCAFGHVLRQDEG